MTKFISGVLTVAIMLVTLAGCGGSALPADARQRVCEGLTSLQTTVAQFAAVDANTKVAELKQIKTKVDGAVQAIKTANQLLKLTAVDQLTASYDDLSTQIDGMSGDSLGASAVQIQTGAQKLNATFAQASTALNCGQ